MSVLFELENTAMRYNGNPVLEVSALAFHSGQMVSLVAFAAAVHATIRLLLVSGPPHATVAPSTPERWSNSSGLILLPCDAVPLVGIETA